MDRKVRIYIDGIFDVFHRGHVEVLRKAKNYRENTTLIVGIISDKTATNYKREPIYNEDDRYTIIESIRYVDEIIFDSPLILTSEFIKKHNIDLVLHSFSDVKDLQKQTESTEKIKDIFHEIPYYKNISTTKIINKI